MNEEQAVQRLSTILEKYPPLQRVEGYVYKTYDGEWGVYIEGDVPLYAVTNDRAKRWCRTLPKELDASIDEFQRKKNGEPS